MTPDDEMLMAYADGELDPLAAKRVEHEVAANPELAATIEAHRALRRRLGAAFAPVLDAPVPDRLAALLETNVIAFAPPVVARPRPRWLSGLAVAASLIAGIVLGTQWHGPAGPVSASGSSLLASGNLARALDTQLASASGETRLLVSFRNRNGSYCRVFATPALEGLACKSGQDWHLRQTRSSGITSGAAYRQATSGDASLLAAAQEMMVGDPLDEAAERRAVAKSWR